MARPASLAVAGYYAAPPEVLPSIAALVRLHVSADHETEHAIVDPCAGEGNALVTLAGAWLNLQEDIYKIYACELEETRADACGQRLWRDARSDSRNMAKGDAFALTWGEQWGRGGGATALWLNSPYDTDPDFGRAEERWLSRFAPAIATGGALLFFVPFYALAASASTLATHFDQLHCFRLPEPHFDVFKQVVLVARKRVPLHAPDSAIEAQVRAWAADAGAAPVLPENGPAVLSVHGLPKGEAGWGQWEIAPLDIQGLLGGLRPWSVTDRSGRAAPIPGVVPHEPFDALLAPRFPVATPPRPAHIAAGIASGALSGARLEPTDPSSGLPSLIVKGTFRRRFHTVDHKEDKHGAITAEVQVQHPELQITALDLRAGRYHNLRSDVARTGTRDVAGMTAGDLLASYGPSLLDTLRDRCPALHDPKRAGDSSQLPALGRSLFDAQEHAVRAVCKLLDKPDKAAVVLGEIGVGKTSVALAAAVARGAQRVLVMCPPHLLQSWADQAAAVVPWARVTVLEDVGDINRLAADDDPGLVIAVLSREAAKLGHAWSGLSGRCPRCGADTPAPPDELARKRVRCEHRSLVAKSAAARTAETLALLLARSSPTPRVQGLLRGRSVQRLVRRWAGGQAPDDRVTAWASARAALAPLVRRLARIVAQSDREPSSQDIEALFYLLLAARDDALTADVAGTIYRASLADPSEWGTGSRLRDTARRIALLLQTPEAREALAADLGATEPSRASGLDPWDAWRSEVRRLHRDGVHLTGGTLTVVNGIHRATLWRPGAEQVSGGTVQAALHALEVLCESGRWAWSRTCDEPLFQAVPEPRRVPLAHYIRRRHPRLFDMAFIDEGQEYGNQDSAQSLAAQQIFALRVPTIVLTGSVMNGYAASLFIVLWSCSAAFRAEFHREDLGEFVRRYGYLKQVVEMRDKQTGEKVSFGAMTDRVERVERTAGQAPGVLPALLLRHLLPIAVTLQIEDLAVDLPPIVEIVERVDPGPELGGRNQHLQRRLLDQIRRDRFEPDRSGRLFGQLAELSSYLDRATADVGNCPGGAFEIRYPEAVGGELVAVENGLHEDIVLPKEERLIEIVKRELAEGRNVMILDWHVQLHDRLARLIKRETGQQAAILRADKVPPAKREAWIDREVIGKKRRVLILNPVAVQTGLNNLVYFATQIWVENPACNPIVRRQARGRIRRIGQTLEARVFSLVYAGTLQEAMHQLLLHKVGVSEAADGLDATAALQAAGVGGADEIAGRDLGRLLYKMLTESAVSDDDLALVRPAPASPPESTPGRAASRATAAPFRAAIWTGARAARQPERRSL